ncbi:MAG: transglutaminaseTgpA domain-containing protein, partial [Bifidobacteriaceae bacterium]|nr:transglutaminaseTgpA domain-containing protein [Bifidobacteriaceae bacterium]
MTIPNQPVPAPPPPLPTAVYRPRASSPWHQAACIALTGLLYISLLAPVSYLLTPTGGWLVLYIVVGAAVLGLGAMARALGWRSGWTALAQLGLVLLIVELVAAWDRAWLGFIPNGAVIEQMGDLATSLGRSFLMEIAPLEPDRAALAFVALAGGMLAWAFDWYVFTVKAPAATGLFALLVVFVAVALVRDTMPMWPLVLVLLAYFALL